MIGLDFGSMDYYGIGFSNIRLPNDSKSYIYKYDPNNCNLENIPQEEINKEVNVMKLSRIKRNPFQKKNL